MVLPCTTGELAARLGAELDGPTSLPVAGVEAIERAGPTDLTFIRSGVFAQAWATSRAMAALVSRSVEVPGHDARTRALLRVEDADLALISILELLAPEPPRRAGIHPTAWVDPQASVDPSASIGPMCVVGPGVVVGRDATLLSRVTMAAGARVGDRTIIHPGCVVQERCSIGRDCILHPNVVIGADGFGFRPSPNGIRKVPHVGTVEVGDLVEIGACSCIDRAKLGATVIGDDTKIDNLVQIAHNARIGRSCLICGNVGIAGSVVVEDQVVIGAGAGISDGVTIGKGARIGGFAGVIESVPPGESWLGYRAGPAKRERANLVALADLAEHVRLLRKLEQRLDALDPP